MFYPKKGKRGFGKNMLCLNVAGYKRVKDLAPRGEHVEEPARIVGHVHRAVGEVNQGLTRRIMVIGKDCC